MKEDYEFWNRIVGEFKDAVTKAESELIVNQVFLKSAQRELKRFPKPKQDPKTSV